VNYLSPLYPRVLRNPHDEDRFSGSSPESVQVQMFIESLKDSREVTADNIAEHVLVSFKICVAQELDLNQYRGKLEALNEELDRIDRLDHDDFPYDTGFYLSFTDRLVQHPYQGEHYLSGVSREACNKHFIDAVRSSLSNKKLKSNLEFFATLPKLWKEAEDHGEAVRAAKQREDGDEAADRGQSRIS
jgi:hypothetical protein